MIDIAEKKEKILEFLKTSGPSIPVRIAKAIEMDPIFASAILSELLGSRQVVISHMRMGASPFYFIPGEEKKLEEHIENLKPIEREVYLSLKEAIVLSDEEQSPAFRVALRNLKDFSKPFKHNDKMMWRYAFSSDEEIDKVLNKNPPARDSSKKSSKEEIEKTPENVVRNSLDKTAVPKKEDIFELPKEDSDFFVDVKNFLKKKNLEFVEEIQSDKKEIVGFVKMVTSLGDLQFLLIAKNKKTTSRDEINSAIQRSMHSKMPCLFLLRKEPTKSIMALLEENKNRIKLSIF